MKKLLLLLLSLMILLPGMKAQDEVQAIEADSLIAESDSVMEDLYPDPEWYVAPIEATVALAPKRALAATSCPIDSVLTFDVDSNFVSVTTFEYDDKGRTVCETEWIYVDGVRVGKSKTEYGFNAAGTQVLTATYEWDGTAKDWKGIKKTEYVYNAQNKMESNTESDWLDGKWSAKTRKTYAYNAAKLEIEFLTYNRNASTKQLVLSKARYRDYNAAGKTILDINYTAYSGENPTAGNKKEYDYDAKGNTIEYTYYSSYSGGNWVGSTHEVWTFLPNTSTKTSYIKQTWSSGKFVNSSKEIWEFVEEGKAKGKQKLHEKYSPSGEDWNVTLREIKEYDENGRDSIVENYELKSGVLVGKNYKYEYTYRGTTTSKTGTFAYMWNTTNKVWDKYSWAVTGYDAAGNTSETCTYTWNGSDWIGNGTRTLKTYNSQKKVTEEITQSWSTDDGKWVNNTRKTTEYDGSKTTKEATFSWLTDINDWVGKTRSDWHYNAKGQNDTIKTYTNNGTDWIYSDRTVNTFNAAGTNIMTHISHWDGDLSKWVLTSMTKTDIVSKQDATGKQEMTASWKCGSDSVWIGLAKDSTSYTAAGKLLYKINFTSWSNNDWVPSYKIECAYDDADRVLLQQQLDWVSNDWKGHYRYEYSYDEYGRQTLSVSYNSWNESLHDWIGSSKSESVYDSQGQVVELIRYTWKDNAWVLSDKYIYTYDDQKRTVKSVFQLYTNGDWVNSEKNEKEYFGEITSKNNTYNWLNNQWVFSSRNETYYDNDAQAKLRREITGSWNNGVVSSFADKHYFYDCDYPYYTIRFENYDGTELQSKPVKETKIPSYDGEKPAKPANAQYTYTFKGWKPALAEVTEAATYTADFDSVVNNYTITFNNYDGSPLQSSDLAYGATPAYTGETPVKPANAQYTYTFKGWKPAIADVTEAATYTADFDSTVNVYTITFYFEDGVVVLDEVEVPYGEMPVCTLIPTKQSDSQYSYTFAGWDPELVPVTGEAGYKAVYDATPIIPTALPETDGAVKATKVMINGRFFILREGHTYTLDGVLVE